MRVIEPSVAILFALVSLAAGPALATALLRLPRLHAALDGFVLTVVVGLGLCVLLPEATATLGAPLAVGLALAGFVLPTIVERVMRRHAGQMTPVLWLALGGLLLHEALDGAGIALGAGATGEAGHAHGAGAAHDHGGHGHDGAVLAILVHRLPVGALVWWSVEPALGRRAAWGLIGAMLVATAGGFALGGHLLELPGPAIGVVHALLAGALVHVVLDHAPPGHTERLPLPSALGALLGATALAATVDLEQVRGGLAAATATLHLALDAAPALLLGFVAAGLLRRVPAAWLARLMRGRTAFGSAIRGVVFGLPLPLCSCGVVPVYRALLRQGVPVGAAAAFLVATPELGPDTVFVSVPLLGVELTLARLVAAFAVALAAGLVAGRLGPGPAEASAAAGELPAQVGWGAALRYGLVDVVDELAPWILVGLLAAGLIEPLLADGALAGVSPWVAVPAAALVALPVYVCASAATPIGAVLLAKGVPAGAVLAGLLSGPATNVTTFGALRTAHGGRGAGVLLGAILAACVLAGWGVEAALGGARAAAVERHAHAPGGALAWTCFAALVALFAASLLREGPRGFLHRLGLGHAHDHAGHDHAGHDHDHGPAVPVGRAAGGCHDGCGSARGGAGSSPVDPAPAPAPGPGP